MAKINILTSDVYNRIAAGEVVERPKSVIKELVENSIDAGATAITIEIEEGGISMMRISDNGSGIDSDYVRTAFLPHATSKVANYEDLLQVSTLGFRGEALPSISSVSNIELVTKSVSEDIGSSIVLRGGEVVSHEACDCNTGTVITVRNLFYNTPARKKFLKKAKSEEADITAIVQGLILSNPDISFKYIADGKMIYSSNGKGLENAVYSIYPTTITKYLTYMEYTAGNIRVSGYVSTPELTKATRAYQTTIVNGRLIKNQLIETAVMRAYGNTLMKRTFPVFILDILIPFDMLDINVTPNKTDVRFADERVVFSAIYRAVESALLKQSKIFGSVSDADNLFVSTTDKKAEQTVKTEKKEKKADNYYTNSGNIELYSDKKIPADNKLSNNDSAKLAELRAKITATLENTSEQKATNESNTQKVGDTAHCNDSSNSSIEEKQPKVNPLIESFREITSDNIRFPNNSSIIKARDAGRAGVSKAKLTDESSALFDEIEDNLDKSSVKVLGQVFNTYVIVTKGKSLYMIDQHAAHERMLYDSLMSKINMQDIVSQPMLVPQIVTLSPQDLAYILDFIGEFEKIGLVMQQFSEDSIKVDSVPTILGSFDASKFIDYMLAEKNKFSQIKVEELLHEKLAMTACKAAIKGGQQLKEIEIFALVRDIEQNKPVQCPHGRPTIIKLSKNDIDKMFKRIV